MIKLLTLLSLFLPLFGEERVYQLPDHHTRLTYELNRLCKKSSHIHIITSSFNHSVLKKGILNGAHKGSLVTLVVNDPNGDPLSMVQYERVNLYTYSHPFTQSIVMIDDSLVCTLDGAFEEEILTSQKHLIRCSDNQQTIRVLKQSQLAIFKQAKPYLE